MKTIFNPNTPSLDQKKTLLLDQLPSQVKKQIIDIFGESVTEDALEQKPFNGNEDVFEAFIDVLPNELVQKKIQELLAQNKNILEALRSMMSLIETRANTWEIDGEEPQQEKALATIKLLSSARFDETLFLGRGNAGHVFTAPEAEGYCIKYLHSPAMQSSNLDGEFALLGHVNEISPTFEALHAPQAHVIAKNIEQTKNFFTMEKISGLTLAQLVNFPTRRTIEYPTMTTEGIITLLEDPTKREKLLGDLAKLHNAGIIHGDIHERNIMLDASGKIYLIDFGNAVIPANVSIHASYENIENIKEIDIKAFNNTFNIVIAQLKNQLTK